MIKIFLFLNDTTEQSGPFEFLPNTNGWYRLKTALKPGHFFEYPKLLTKGVERPYQSMDEDKIERIIASGYKPTPVIVKQGTVMVVNPSALIHRARPCNEGNRYVLTAYFGGNTSGPILWKVFEGLLRTYPSESSPGSPPSR